MGQRSQFRLLAAHFVRRFLDNDLVSAAQDLHDSISTVLAGFLVVSATVALAFLVKYNPRGRQPLLDERLAMALDDKTLLIGGAMVVMALVAALAWDALSLDVRDFRILGPLPIRPPTLLAAKSAAVAALAIGCALAITIVPAFFFPLVMLARAHAGIGYGLQSMAALAIGSAGGCLFAFLAVLALRGLVFLASPASVSRRLLTTLQFVLVPALLVLLFVLPILATRTRPAVEAGSSWLRAWPPLWFLGLEEVLIGRMSGPFPALARTALAALALGSTAACAVHVATFVKAARGQNAIQPEADRLGRHRPVNRAARVLNRLGRAIAPDHLVRASYAFTVHVLTRSRLHRLCVGAYLGLGAAVAVGSVVAALGGFHISRQALDVNSMALAAQANLLFFLVVGVRVAAGFPADLKAAWLFRLHAGPALDRHLAGTRRAVFVLAVAPLLLVLAPVHAWLWGPYVAFVHLASGTILALVLLDVVFLRFDRLPFVSAHSSDRTVLTLRLPGYLIGYLFFVFVSSGIERLVFRHPGLLVGLAAAMVMAVRHGLSGSGRSRRPDRLPAFDEIEAVATLDVSQAVFDAPSAEDTGDRQPVREPQPGRARVPSQWLSLDDASQDQASGDGRRPSWTFVVEQVFKDVRLACRRIAASPAFTLFSILTLALGIGTTTAVYSVIHAFVLTPSISVQGLDRVVNIYHADPTLGVGAGHHNVTLSLPDYRDLRESQSTFDELTAWAAFGEVVAVEGAAQFAWCEFVDGNYFHLLRTGAARGRTVQPLDDQPAAPAVAVISDAFWRERFGGDPAVIGRTLRVRGRALEVIGVAPASFRGVNAPKVLPTALWIPLAQAPLVGEREDVEDREARWLQIKARLKTGRTVGQASADVASIGRGLDQAAPIGALLPEIYRYWHHPDVCRRWCARPAASVRVDEQADASLASASRWAMAAVFLVMLVACSNLANLRLAGGAARRQDLAVRLALGASRRRLVAEQVVESALVALLGGAAALALARVLMTRVLTTTVSLGAGARIDLAPALNLPVAFIAFTATALALAVFGLAPALQAARTAGQAVLAGGVANTVPRWRGRRRLLACQVGISVALVAIAAACVQEVVASARHRFGFDVDRLVVARLDFRLQGWDEARARSMMSRVLELGQAAPGFDGISVSSGLPAGPGAYVYATTPDQPWLEGQRGGRKAFGLLAATPAIFSTLGVRLERGRPFDGRDTIESARVAVISQQAARLLFGAVDPIGRPIVLRYPSDVRSGEETASVVGLAADTDTERVGRREEGLVYVPLAQHYEPLMTIVARTRREPANAIGPLRDLAARAAPDLALLDVATGPAVAGAERIGLQLMAKVTGLLGILAFAIAMSGLYGVLSYLVARRTGEIGVRMALGASPLRILRLVISEGLQPVAFGLIVGFTLAELTGMALRPLFVRLLPSIDPLMYALVPVPFVAAAVLASYLPARRAAHVDPNEALRQL